MRLAILFLCVSYTVGFAQRLSRDRMEDSVSLRSLVFPDRRFSFTEQSFLLPLSSAGSVAFMNLSMGSSRTVLFLQQPVLEERFDLVSSMHLQWKREDPLQTLRKALGIVQAGGAAYLTYLALKKYGYIK